MKLRERFLKLYPHQSENYLDVDEAILCEKIADDFAIGFAEWIEKNRYNMKYYIQLNNTKQLLEIYKKEKGL